MKVVGCRIGNWRDAQYVHKEHDPTAPPDVIKKINWRIHQWESVNKLHPNHPHKLAQDTALQVFYDRLYRISNIVEQGRFNPNIRKAVQTRAVDRLGRLRDAMLRASATVPTEKALVGFERRARGLVSELFQDLEVVKLADGVHKLTKEIQKRYGITADQAYELQWGAIELATQPYLLEATLEASEVTYRLLAKRQDAVFEMFNRLGVNQADTDRIVDAAKQMVQANAEVAKFAGEIGVDIKVLDEMGYMPRIFTNEMKDIYNIIENGGVVNPKNRPVMLTTGADVTAAFQEGRKYFDFVAEDAAVLDYWFKKSKVYDKLNDQLQKDDKLRALLGKDSVSKFDDLFSAPTDAILSHAFVNIVDPDDLDTLLELGFIHKVPWETSRVWRYLQEKYQLPFGLSDMFISDPARVMDMYSKQLTSLAANRGKVWGILRGAIDEWGLPEDFVATRKEYSDWVPLSNAFPTNVVETIAGTSDELEYHLTKTFIPPEVAKLINADLTIVTDPLMMGIAGNVLKIFKSWFGGFMLGTSQWFGRQVFGWAGNVLARGVNPMGYFMDISRYAYARMDTWKKGLSDVSFAKYLPNKKKTFFGGTMTEADVWKLGVRMGMFQDFNVFGEQATHQFRGWKRTGRELKWFMDTFPKHFGQMSSGDMANIMTRSVKELMGDNNYASYFLSWGNNLTDNMGKFALLKALGNDKRLAVPNLFDPLPQRLDPKDAVQWVFDHSWNYDDLNVGGRKLWNNDAVQFVVPFLQWRLKNTQQAALMLAEHPHLFGSYLYLTSRPNDQFQDERPVEYEMINDSWWDEGSRPLWWVIPGELHPSGKEQKFMYPLTNFIPQLGAVQDIDDIFDTLQVFGTDKSKVASDRTDNPYKKRWGFLQRLAKEQTLPVVESLISLYTEEDNWGQTYQELRDKGKKRTLLGVPVDPVVHYHVTNLMPIVKQVDRSLSYTGLTGTAPTVDMTTGDFTPGTPSWVGTVPDYPVMGQQPTFVNKPADFFLQAIGMLPYHINVEFAAQRKPIDIRIMLKEGEKKLNTMRYRLAQARSQKEVGNLQLEYDTYLTWNMHLAIELEIYESWRKRMGISDKKATDAILQQNLYIGDLVSEEERRRIENEITQKYLNSPYHNP